MTVIHTDKHPLAGRTVTIKYGVVDGTQGLVVGGAEGVLEDWWDRGSGHTHSESTLDGNPAALQYTIRQSAAAYAAEWLAKCELFIGFEPLDPTAPDTNEVVYIQIPEAKHGFRLGNIVHISEIEGYAELMAQKEK